MNDLVDGMAFCILYGEHYRAPCQVNNNIYSILVKESPETMWYIDKRRHIGGLIKVSCLCICLVMVYYLKTIGWHKSFALVPPISNCIYYACMHVLV